MRLLTLILFATGFSFVSAQTPPKADRSAEPRLKQVFAAMGKLRAVDAEVGIVSRDSSREPWYPASRIRLQWQSDAGFRIEQTGSWGDGLIYQCDGATLLVDFLYIATGVTLKEAKPTIWECDASLAPRGGAFSPLYCFLYGEKGMAELVDPLGDIVACPASKGEEGIRFKTRKVGTMRIYFRPSDRDLKVIRFEYDNLDFRKEQAVQFAEWGAEMPVDPLDVHDVTYRSTNRRFPKGSFSTVPPKGLQVQDQRPKKPPTALRMVLAAK